jgi:hypothetical protein
LKAQPLASWLLEEGFAVVRPDGCLAPTERVSTLGVGLLVPVVDA